MVIRMHKQREPFCLFLAAVAQVAFVPFTCLLVCPPCGGIQHLAVEFTVIDGKLPPPGEPAVPDCAVHQRQIHRNLQIMSLLTHQLWKTSLLTGVAYWLMSSCSMPVWARSWFLLINWPSELKRKEIQGYHHPSHLLYLGGCGMMYHTVLHGARHSVF